MPGVRPPLKVSDKITAALCVCLIGLNAALFIRANTWPISYEQTEIAFHKMFWSMDGLDQYTLHSGFKNIDWVKPFASRPVDGEFRARQLSYLLEMLYAKFHQWFGIVDARNFFLLGLHLINTALLGILIFYLTQNKFAGILSACMFLNSGIALMTLAFPFRNAKLLVMTFFLLSWLMLASGPARFSRSSRTRFAGFFVFLLLAFFTDEYAVFLSGLLFMYIGIRDGKEGVLNKRMLTGIVTTATACAVCTALFFRLSKTVDPSINMVVYQSHLDNLRGYFLNTAETIKELAYAFFFYFLPRSIGYWKPSGWGVAALAVSLIALNATLTVKPDKKHLLTVGALLAMLFLKNLFLPHNNDDSYHPGIIPEGITFPSLLFFDLYYVYCETVLLFLAIALLLDKRLKSLKNLVVFLAMFTVVNFSNYIHIKEAMIFGIADENRTFLKIVSAKKLLKQASAGATYLSFPSGNNSLFKRSLRQFDPSSYKAALNIDFEEYATSIPVYFLRDIEEGRVIISLENAKPKKTFSPFYELMNAEYFLDVPQRELFPLSGLKNSYGREAFKPQLTSEEAKILIRQPSTPQQKAHCILFVKGGAKISIASTGLQRTTIQTYGESYQMFRFELGPDILQSGILLSLRPIRNQSVAFVGPFVIETKI